MQNVLADLALESEAMTAASMRIARTYDTEDELPLRRFGTAVMKYWICKRGPLAAVEALECLGGNGFVEESIMAPVLPRHRDRHRLGGIRQRRGSRRDARGVARARGPARSARRVRARRRRRRGAWTST